VITEEGEFAEQVRSESADVLAPLPTLALGGGYRIADSLYLSADLGYLSLSIDKYDGRIFSSRTQLEWRPWERLGIGAGYQFIDLDLDVDEGRINESYNLQLDGPTLFLSYGF